MLKILFVYDSFSPIGGGSQQAVYTWFKNINSDPKFKKKAKAKLLISKYGYKWSKKLFSRKDLENLIISDKALNLHKLYPYFSLSYKLDKDLEHKLISFSPHIIQLNEPSLLDLFLLKFSKKSSIKIGSFFHTQFKKVAFPFSLISFIQNYVFKYSDFILTPTNYLATHIKQQYKELVYKVNYPVKRTFFLNSSKLTFSKIKKFKKKISLTFIGRLSPEKHPEFLIDLIKSLPENYFLNLVGDGILKDKLKQKVKKLGLEKRVFLLGWLKHEKLKKHLEKTHFLLLPSSFETFGIVYIEALASFTPVITLETEVTKEVLPKNTALLLPGLSHEQWKKELLKIDDKKYKKMLFAIKENYGYLLKYEETNSTKKLIEIYKKVLKL